MSRGYNSLAVCDWNQNTSISQVIYDLKHFEDKEGEKQAVDYGQGEQTIHLLQA